MKSKNENKRSALSRFVIFLILTCVLSSKELEFFQCDQIVQVILNSCEIFIAQETCPKNKV
jgi:hypothetical protein